MRLAGWCSTGLLCGVLLVGAAPAASADLGGSSACSASATLYSSGTVIDPATATGVVPIERSDTVEWQAWVAGPPRDYTGSVWLELPPPFGSVELKSWSGSSSTVANAGVDEYSIPKVVPAGVEFAVAGRHTDDNGVCEGSVRLEIEGSPLSSPITWLAIGGTAATGAGLATALAPLLKKVA